MGGFRPVDSSRGNKGQDMNFVCRRCGFKWQRCRVLVRCPNSDCRSRTWNREKKSTAIHTQEGLKRIREASLTHGHTAGKKASRTFNSWRAMIGRCLNPNAFKYSAYGARGVKVCDRWREFSNFLADMGERPEGKTIDRWPDPAGNYEPINCRWATPKEQRLNQRISADRVRTLQA